MNGSKGRIKEQESETKQKIDSTVFLNHPSALEDQIHQEFEILPGNPGPSQTELLQTRETLVEVNQEMYTVQAIGGETTSPPSSSAAVVIAVTAAEVWKGKLCSHPWASGAVVG